MRRQDPQAWVRFKKEVSEKGSTLDTKAHLAVMIDLKNEKEESNVLPNMTALLKV